MLVVRMEQPARRAELGSPVGPAAVAQGGGHFRQDDVVRAVADHRMQLLVGRLEVFDEFAPGHLAHALMETLQVLALQRRHAHRRQARAGGFQLHHGDEHVIQLIGRQLGDEGYVSGIFVLAQPAADQFLDFLGKGVAAAARRNDKCFDDLPANLVIE